MWERPHKKAFVRPFINSFEGSFLFLAPDGPGTFPLRGRRREVRLRKVSQIYLFFILRPRTRKIR
jgi:hypothetical protein